MRQEKAKKKKQEKAEEAARLKREKRDQKRATQREEAKNKKRQEAEEENAKKGHTHTHIYEDTGVTTRIDALRCLHLSFYQDTPQQIRKAYHALALRYHPDKNPDPSAPAQFRKVQTAYELLTSSAVPADCL